MKEEENGGKKKAIYHCMASEISGRGKLEITKSGLTHYDNMNELIHVSSEITESLDKFGEVKHGLERRSQLINRLVDLLLARGQQQLDHDVVCQQQDPRDRRQQAPQRPHHGHRVVKQQEPGTVG